MSKLIEKTGYVFQYRGSGYCYDTLEQVELKLNQLYARDRSTPFNWCVKSTIIRKGKTITDENKNLIELEYLDNTLITVKIEFGNVKLCQPLIPSTHWGRLGEVTGGIHT